MTTEDMGDKSEIAGAIKEGAQLLVGKSSVWAVSLGLAFFSAAIALGGFFWLAGDKIVAIQQASADIRNLQNEHEHCIMEVADLKSRVTTLEAKTTASNP